MKKLTKVEEEVMQVIWELGRCTVSQILREMGDPETPHSTVSSVVRILEKKGFLDHQAYGRTYEYFPIVERRSYTKKSLGQLIKDYFGGSVESMVSFLVEENEMDPDEIKKMLDDLNKKK